jgi:hypothetical protein
VSLNCLMESILLKSVASILAFCDKFFSHTFNHKITKTESVLVIFIFLCTRSFSYQIHFGLSDQDPGGQNCGRDLAEWLID